MKKNCKTCGACKNIYCGSWVYLFKRKWKYCVERNCFTKSTFVCDGWREVKETPFNTNLLKEAEKDVEFLINSLGSIQAYVVIDGTNYYLDVTVDRDMINAGTYTLMAAKRAGDDINFTLESDSTTVTVKPASVDPVWYNNGVEITGGKLVITYGDTVNVTAEYNGVQFAVDSSLITATTNAGLHTAAIRATAPANGNYAINENKGLLDVQIDAYEIDASSIIWTNDRGENFINSTGTFYENGDEKLPRGQFIGLNKEQINVYVQIVGDPAINASATPYQATITGVSNANYKIVGNMTVEFIIVDGENVVAYEVSWNVTSDAASREYNGSEVTLSASIEVEGNTVALDVVMTGANVTGGKAINAGYYTAVARVADGSAYALTKNSLSFTISPKQISAVDWNVTGATLSGNKVTYTYGNAPVVTASFTDGGNDVNCTVTSTGISDLTAVGVYTSAFKAASTNSNYVIAESAAGLDAEILAKTLDTDNIVWTFNNQTFKGGAVEMTYVDGRTDYTPVGYILDSGLRIEVEIDPYTVNTAPSTAVTVNVAIKQPANTNYVFPAGSTVSLTLNPPKDTSETKQIINLVWETLPETLSFGEDKDVTVVTTDMRVSFDIFKDGKIFKTVTLESGESLKLNAKADALTVGSYTIEAYSSNNYYTIIGGTKAKFTVSPAKLNVNDVVWYNDQGETIKHGEITEDNKLSFLYDGKIKSPIGKIEVDGVTLEVVISNVLAINAGEYEADILGVSDSNYSLTGKVKFEIVGKLSLRVEWSGVDGLVYGNDVKTVTAEADGVTLTVKYEKFVNNAWTTVNAADLKDAGRYKLTATTAAEGVELTNDAVEFEIKPLTVTVTWGTTEFNYGDEIKVTASYVKCGETDATELTVTLVNNIENAGTYLNAASVTLEDGNYVLANPTVNVTVKAIELDIDDVVWTNDAGDEIKHGEISSTNKLTFTYNGKVKTPVGTITVDDETFYVIITNQNAVEVGTYTATVTGVSNANYSLTGTISFEIVKAPIPVYTVNWLVNGGNDLVYTGKNLVSSIQAYIVVDGANHYLDVTADKDIINVGSYTVIAEKAENDTLEFTLDSNSTIVNVVPASVDPVWYNDGVEITGGKLVVTYGDTVNITAEYNGVQFNVTSSITSTTNAGLHTAAVRATARPNSNYVINENKGLLDVQIDAYEIDSATIVWTNDKGENFINSTGTFYYNGDEKLPRGQFKGLNNEQVNVYVEIDGDPAIEISENPYKANITGVSNANYKIVGQQFVKFNIVAGDGATPYEVTWSATASEISREYDGTEVTLTASIEVDGEGTVNLDVVMTGANVTDGKAIHAGYYTAVAKIPDGSKYYALTKNSLSFTISPKEINTVIWKVEGEGASIEDNTVTYTYGNVPVITATFEDDGQTFNCVVTRFVTNVSNAQHYDRAAQAVSTNGNYVLSSSCDTLSAEVVAKELDPNDIIWTNYRGQTFKGSAIEMYYVDGRTDYTPTGYIVDNGNHIVVELVEAFEQNSAPTRPLTSPIEIKQPTNTNYVFPAQSTVSITLNPPQTSSGQVINLTWGTLPEEIVYGESANITVVTTDMRVSLEILKNGAPFRTATLNGGDDYTINPGVGNWDAGLYTVRAYSPNNYRIEGGTTINFTVSPATINADDAKWIISDYNGNQVQNAVYNSQNFTVSLLMPNKLHVAYTGTVSAKNPGEYTVNAVSLDSNYVLDDTLKTFTWSIAGAQVTTSFNISADGKNVTVHGNATSQAVNYVDGKYVNGSFITAISYYDKNGKLDGMPTVAGTYRAVITLEKEHEGYVTLNGDTAVNFTIKIDETTKEPVIDSEKPLDPTDSDAPLDDLSDVNNPPKPNPDEGDIGVNPIGNNIIPIVVGVAAGVVALLLLILIIVLVKRSRKAAYDDPDGFNEDMY